MIRTDPMEARRGGDPSTRATASGRGPSLRVVLSERSESKDDAPVQKKERKQLMVERALRDLDAWITALGEQPSAEVQTVGGAIHRALAYPRQQ